MTRLILPLCTHLPHKSQSQPISSVTTIIDLSSVSITSMWSLRSHLQEASKLATANYPETLSTIAVVNSPSFFPTIWGWIKVTHSYPHFLGSNGFTLDRAGLTKAHETRSTFLEETLAPLFAKSSSPRTCPKSTAANWIGRAKTHPTWTTKRNS